MALATACTTACTTTLISTIPSVAYYSYNAIRKEKDKEPPPPPPPDLDVDQICVLRYRQSKRTKKSHYFVVGAEELKECKYKHIEEAYNKIISAGYGLLKGEHETRWKKILDHGERDEQKAIMVFYKLENDEAKGSDKKIENAPVAGGSSEAEVQKGVKAAQNTDDESRKSHTSKRRWLPRRDVEDSPLSSLKEQETLNCDDPQKKVEVGEPPGYSENVRSDAKRQLWRPRRDEEQSKSSTSTKTEKSNREGPKNNLQPEDAASSSEDKLNEKIAELGSFWGFSKTAQTSTDSTVSTASASQSEETDSEKRNPIAENRVKKDRLGLPRKKTEKNARKATLDETTESEEQFKSTTTIKPVKSNHEGLRKDLQPEVVSVPSEDKPNQKVGESSFWSFGKAAQSSAEIAVSIASTSEADERDSEKNTPSAENRDKKDRVGLLRKKTEKSARKAAKSKIRKTESEELQSATSTKPEESSLDDSRKTKPEAAPVRSEDQVDQKIAESSFWGFGKAVQSSTVSTISSASTAESEENESEKSTPSAENRDKKDRVGLLRKKTEKGTKQTTLSKIKSDECRKSPLGPKKPVESPPEQQIKPRKEFHLFGASAAQQATTESSVALAAEETAEKVPLWPFIIEMENFLRFGKPLEGKPEDAPQPKDDEEKHEDLAPINVEDLAPVEALVEASATESGNTKNRLRVFRKDKKIIKKAKSEKMEKKRPKLHDGETANAKKETTEEDARLEQFVVSSEASAASEVPKEKIASGVLLEDFPVAETSPAWPFVIDMEAFWSFGKTPEPKVEEPSLPKDDEKHEEVVPEEVIEEVVPAPSATKEDEKKKNRVLVFLKDQKAKKKNAPPGNEEHAGRAKLEDDRETKVTFVSSNADVDPGLRVSAGSAKSKRLGKKSGPQSQASHNGRKGAAKKFKRKVEESVATKTKKQNQEPNQAPSREGGSPASASKKDLVEKNTETTAETTAEINTSETDDRTGTFWRFLLPNQPPKHEAPPSVETKPKEGNGQPAQKAPPPRLITSGSF